MRSGLRSFHIRTGPVHGPSPDEPRTGTGPDFKALLNKGHVRPWETAQEWDITRKNTTLGFPRFQDDFEFYKREYDQTLADLIELRGVQVDRNKYPSLQCTSAQIKGNGQVLLKPVVLRVEVNGHPVRALLDSGSLEYFISSMLVDQLSIK